ncbi:MAG: phosphohydrolase [Candidatus Goldiibacteriota bacterium HGW-Goldbacteria-1]|jgi:putative hydrolase of HD superfamily|nr:MAG: phosphohydrolase [Candidatus Goldiibacteriota bacterium HGW-Goldbacteria-1]
MTRKKQKIILPRWNKNLINSGLYKQLEFIKEIDKLKSIFRKTRILDNSRHENDAEHSYHLAMMAVILSGYSNTKIDVNKVIKMVLVHDLPEIYSGDIMVYNKKQGEISKEDNEAADKIFGMVPAPMGDELKALWREFEEKKTPEAKFAAAIDRLEPIMQNHAHNGGAWVEHKISKERVVEVNSHIGNGSAELWEYARNLIEECADKGFIK